MSDTPVFKCNLFFSCFSQWTRSITWRLQHLLPTTCTIPSKQSRRTLLVLLTCLVSTWKTSHWILLRVGQFSNNNSFSNIDLHFEVWSHLVNTVRFIIKYNFVLHFLRITVIHLPRPFSTTYPVPNRRGSSLSGETDTFLSPGTSTNSSEGILRCSQTSREI